MRRFAKARAADRQDRYSTVQEMADDVERYLDDGTVSALPESMWVKLGRLVARHKVAVILILVYVLVRTLVLLYGGR